MAAATDFIPEAETEAAFGPGQVLSWTRCSQRQAGLGPGSLARKEPMAVGAHKGSIPFKEGPVPLALHLPCRKISRGEGASKDQNGT